MSTNAPSAPGSAPASSAPGESGGEATAPTEEKKSTKKASYISHLFGDKYDPEAEERAEGTTITDYEKEMADFDWKKFGPLTKGDFGSIWMFYQYQADVYTAKATALGKQAEQAKKLGNVKDEKKARRLLQMAQALEALKAELGDEGAALLASLNEDKDEE